ncbi:MAG: malonyl-ACP O-methyltransferase BioC [Proteobacteria bacterium]|nr:malonyl-ACP O-methyltransferase BioC [Pseudomonadota bacterium]
MTDVELENRRDYQADKTQLARSFNIAAPGYDNVALLQQTVAKSLLERLELINISPENILDLGSGTGMAAKMLAKIYTKARVTQTDLAFNMLNTSRSNARRFFSRQSYVCADADDLPFKASVFDLVFSNLMLQWCSDADRVFNGVKQSLRADGLFLFSSFGPDTLFELRESWATVDSTVHVNAFIDMHDIGDALIRAGFEQPVMETERLILSYDDVYSLMRELKSLGAHNVVRGRRKSLTGKRRLQKMIDAYETRRSEAKLPATYEIVYGHAWCPHTLTAKKLDGVTAVFPVSAITRRGVQ